MNISQHALFPFERLFSGYVTPNHHTVTNNTNFCSFLYLPLFSPSLLCSFDYNSVRLFNSTKQVYYLDGTDFGFFPLSVSFDNFSVANPSAQIDKYEFSRKFPTICFI